MITIQSENFSMAQICASGQNFRMEECGDNRYCLVALGRYLEAVQEGSSISFDCSPEEFDSVWKTYFDLETDYAAIISGIDQTDKYLTAAAEYGKGIRILRQDLWEVIVSSLFPNK